MFLDAGRSYRWHWAWLLSLDWRWRAAGEAQHKENNNAPGEITHISPQSTLRPQRDVKKSFLCALCALCGK